MILLLRIFFKKKAAQKQANKIIRALKYYPIPIMGFTYILHTLKLYIYDYMSYSYHHIYDKLQSVGTVQRMDASHHGLQGL